MKVLLLDIETAPNTVHTWGLFDQNIGINQIIASGYTLCWSAKWLGQEEVMFSSTYHDGRESMLQAIHSLVDEAHAVVHYNGTKFDIPTLNKEFLVDQLSPPSPVKQIDLLRTARSQFRFPSNKLDYIAQALGLGNKIKHIGHELWIKCMNNDPDAWQQMMEYNIQDVMLLEKLYYKLLPWIKGHPNVSLYEEDEAIRCTACGGTHVQRRGYYYTNSYKYQRYQCQSCNKWLRGARTVSTPNKERVVSV